MQAVCGFLAKYILNDRIFFVHYKHSLYLKLLISHGSYILTVLGFSTDKDQ